MVNERKMVKMIWAFLWNMCDPTKDYQIGHRFVKKQFREDGFIKSEAAERRFDRAWQTVREKMKKMA